MRRLVLALLAAGLGGCGLGPIWAPRVEGRVVDSVTGAPVAGAAVAVYHEQPDISGHTPRQIPVAVRVTRTDADGGFSVRGEFEIYWSLFRPRYRPTVRVEHPLYGTAWVEDAAAEPLVELQQDGYGRDDWIEGDVRCDRAEADPCFWACLGNAECFEKAVVD